MNEEMLIGLVRNYVFLYDTSHPKYMDSTKKDAAWNEISQVMNQPGLSFFNLARKVLRDLNLDCCKLLLTQCACVGSGYRLFYFLDLGIILCYQNKST